MALAVCLTACNNGTAQESEITSPSDAGSTSTASTQGASSSTPEISSSAESNNTRQSSSETPPKSDAPVQSESEPQPKDDKTLVVYFTWSSNTAEMAETIANLTGADTFEIVPVNPYPEEYTPCTEVALEERDNNARPEIQNLPASVSEVDTVSRASVVVKDGKKFGNTEYVANVVQQTIGGDLFHIETVREYTHDHDALTDYAADEKADNARPELKNHIDNISKYDIIILGYPNWWADLPMPVYTFLEEYDFGGKTIIPFVTHGGSGFSNTRKTIADLQPNAAVSDNSLNLSRNNILENEDEIIQWAKSLT